MVLTSFPATVSTGVTQERVAAPSMCTVQAPHWEPPQPYFVPVRPRLSRRTQRRGVEGSTSTSCRLPLTVIAIIAVPPLRNDGGDGSTFPGSSVARCRREPWGGRGVAVSQADAGATVYGTGTGE